MRIGIDARFYGPFGKGLGRYTQKLIQHLEQIDHQNQYVIFLRKENFDDYQPLNKNFKKVLANYSWYSFSEQIFFPLMLSKYKFDLMHFPHFNVPLLYFGKFVLTVHDLILIHFPTLRGTTLHPLWYKIKYLAYKLAIYSAIKRSEKVIVVSEFTKKDVLDRYPVARDKITVTYLACDDLCRVAAGGSHQILEKYGMLKPYLLYVGNAYPHKNLEKLVESFDLILKEYPDLQLGLVGKEDFFYARLKKFVKDRNIPNVHFLGFVNDDDLDILYHFCEVYVFPSLYEGFGLPPLEAMAKGTPVVCSDHSCMKEALGDAALFVDAKKTENFAEGVINVLKDVKLKQQLIEKGYRQIAKYSWERMARETLEIYQNSL